VCAPEPYVSSQTSDPKSSIHSTHMLTIVDNHRDTYESRVCLYFPSGVTGSEIHLILECPATSHVAQDLNIIILSNSSQPSSMTPGNQIGAPSSPTNKHPLSWVTPHLPFPKISSRMVAINPPYHPRLRISTGNCIIQHDVTFRAKKKKFSIHK